MDKIIRLTLTRKGVPDRIDYVQFATLPRIIFVLDDFTPVSGSAANLYIEKPDGNLIYNSCEIDGNEITYSPTTQSFAVIGLNKCQLQIIEPNGTAISFTIYVMVHENIIDADAVESTDEWTALEEAVQQIAEFEGRIQNVETTVSDVQSEITTLESTKQDNLVSGVNIKTINGQTLLGAGNVVVELETDLLWTNETTNTSFAAQTIALDLSEYKFVAIETLARYLTKQSSTLWFPEAFKSYTLIPINDIPYILSTGAFYVARHGYDSAYYREFTAARLATASATGITFSGGIEPDKVTTSYNDAYHIPIRIWGIKG